MDNDDKTIGTILTRRDALKAASVAGVTLLLGRTEAQTTPLQGKTAHLIATPEVEEGPFFVDEGLNRKNICEGTRRKSVVDGLPLKLRFTVLALRDSKAEPLEGAHIDIWHSDAAGTYSDEESGGIQQENTKGQRWLRGYQFTDKEGVAEFQTIYPVWYPSRTVHIHVKLRTYDANSNKTHEFTTQVYFEEAHNDKVLSHPPYSDRGQRKVRNAEDGLYATKQADGTMVGSHLHMSVSDLPNGSGKRAEFALALKLS